MAEVESKANDKRIEMKFLLDAPLSTRARAWAREHLGVDANGNVDGGDSYDLNTLYLDTAELDVFHRTGVAGLTKHRIRRYANDTVLWLETKRKKQMVVSKSRTVVAESELSARLATVTDPAAVEAVNDPWCGDWFLQRVAKRALRPMVQVSYRRFARTAIIAGESLRLTIDSHMRARPVDGWRVAHNSAVGKTSAYQAAEPPNEALSPYNGELPFGESQILELKFHNHMPQLFKQLLLSLAIPTSGFSKYSHAVQALGLAPTAGHSAQELVLDA